MALDDILLDAEGRMEQAVKVLDEELRSVRTGRATSALVENIKVDYYGSPTPLKQLANIVVSESNVLVIRPFDPSCLKEIEKAIFKSEIGIVPQTDAKVVRLVVPPVSEERRKQLAHQVKHTAEQAKVAIRNVRKDANKHIEREEGDSGVSEDEVFKAKEEVQNLTKDYEKKVDEVLEHKTKEIMEI